MGVRDHGGRCGPGDRHRFRRAEPGFTVQLRHRRENDELRPVSGKAMLDLDRLDAAGDDYGRELTLRGLFRPSPGRVFPRRLSDDPGPWRLPPCPAPARAGGRAPLRAEVGAAGAALGRRYRRRPPPALHQQIYFARFLGSFDWRPVRLRRKGERLQVLVAVASPSDPTGRFGLAPIDADAEVARARKHSRAEPLPPIEPGPDALAQINAEAPAPRRPDRGGAARHA